MQQLTACPTPSSSQSARSQTAAATAQTTPDFPSPDIHTPCPTRRPTSTPSASAAPASDCPAAQTQTSPPSAPRAHAETAPEPSPAASSRASAQSSQSSLRPYVHPDNGPSIHHPRADPPPHPVLATCSNPHSS